jgi:peptidyl-tRNA hydrolase
MKEVPMPLFMDVHETMPDGATAADVAQAHAADVATQDQYGVTYMKYWVDESQRKIFCLVDAPDAETAARVHREAHGLEADHIYEVREGQ